MKKDFTRIFLTLAVCTLTLTGFSLPAPAEDTLADEVARELEALDEMFSELDEAGPEEDGEDFVAEEVVVVPFEMEGARRVASAELDAAIALPAEITAESLLDFFMALESLEPDAETQADAAALAAFDAKIAAAKWDAGSRLLEMKDAQEDFRRMAVEMLLSVAFHLPETYLQKMKALPEELRAAGEPRVAWEVENGLLLLTSSLVMQEEQTEDAGKMTLLADTCAGLISHLEKGQAAGLAGEDDVFMLAISLIMYGEMLPAEKKGALYKKFAPLTKTAEDEQLRLLGVLMERAVGRFESVGKPLDVTFETVSGETLKPADFAGKTLAIYFWSPENEISLRELALLAEFYDFYHAAGLEVLGVALGGESDELDELLADGAFPWETAVDDTTDAAAEAENLASLDTPAVTLGVLECPTLMLVGPDGKVVSAEMNLLELLAYLEKMYGEYRPADTD